MDGNPASSKVRQRHCKLVSGGKKEKRKWWRWEGAGSLRGVRRPVQHGCGKDSRYKITQVQLRPGQRGKTTERLTGLKRRDTTLDPRWTKGLSEPSFSQILTENVRVVQKSKQCLAGRAFPPQLQWKCQLFIDPF